MTQDPLAFFKLVVLYMLGRVDFPLMKAQIGDFILERKYIDPLTNFLTLQQAIAELIDAGLVSAKSNRNRTYLSITDEGREALSYFEKRLSHSVRKDIDEFFNANELKMRNEVSILADYYKSVSGEYEAHLIAKEKDVTMLEITLSVPNEELASSICTNWHKKNQDIYQYLTEQLF